MQNITNRPLPKSQCSLVWNSRPVAGLDVLWNRLKKSLRLLAASSTSHFTSFKRRKNTFLLPEKIAFPPENRNSIIKEAAFEERRTRRNRPRHQNSTQKGTEQARRTLRYFLAAKTISATAKSSSSSISSERSLGMTYPTVSGEKNAFSRKNQGTDAT